MENGSTSMPFHTEYFRCGRGMLTAVTCGGCCYLCLTPASVSPRAAVFGGRGNSSCRSTTDCAVSSCTSVYVHLHVCEASPVFLSSTHPASVERSLSPRRCAPWALAQSFVRMLVASPISITLAVRRFNLRHLPACDAVLCVGA